jgi:hypothetical protein
VTDPKRDLRPEYQHIPLDAPLDAAGDPVFLILPPGVQESYDAKMRKCEAGWLETRDPLFVAEAITLAGTHRQPIRMWLDDAVYELAIGRRTPERAKAAQDAANRLMQYLAVRDAHDRDGLTWEQARVRVAEALGIAEDTVWKGYKAVKRRLKDRPETGFGFYAPRQERKR